MLSKLFRKYPFLIDSAFVRSRTEAEKIVQSGSFPSCKEFIKRAKKNSVLPPEVWSEFERALNVKSKS